MSDKLKVCLVGATGVGKTSLVERYVRSVFSDRYRTTIGVGIERRNVQHGDRAVELVIWDLSGEDEFQNVQPAYLRGAAGYVLVVDGTRVDTIRTAATLEARVRAAVGELPVVTAVNKADLSDTWALRPHDLDSLERLSRGIVYTSAKTGASVDELFDRLVEAIYMTAENAWI
jgi:small GTP-binding protein